MSESMNFLNEIAIRFPDAVSLAAGRPYEGSFSVAKVHDYIDTFRAYLDEKFDGDQVMVNRTLMQYGRTKGIIHELVAEHLRVDEAVDVDPESLVVTVGCQEALYLTLRALKRDERDALLAIVPSYVGVHGAAQLVDMPLLPVADDGTGVDLADLGRVVEEARASGLRPRAFYVSPDFANPSGVSLTRERRQAVLDAAREHDFLVLEDNPYGMFGPDPTPRTLKSLDREGVVVYLGSFAKTGLPGARVGYVVADQQVVDGEGGRSLFADQLAKVKSMLTVNTSPIAQAVIGGKLLENGYSLRRANEHELGVYQRNLRQVLEGLAKRFPQDGEPAVTWNAPEGGFFAVVTVPFDVDDEVLEHSARTHGVLWTPIHHFYADQCARNRIRLSFSHLGPDEIEAGLDRFAAFIEKRVQ